MNEKKYSVYIHDFPNGKKYVGLTYQLPERRWNNGNGYKNQYVYNAIMEFGWDNVEHTVVQRDLSAHEASILEQELIEKYDTIKNGYNRTAGGELSAGTPYLYMYKDKNTRYMNWQTHLESHIMLSGGDFKKVGRLRTPLKYHKKKNITHIDITENHTQYMNWQK